MDSRTGTETTFSMRDEAACWWETMRWSTQRSSPFLNAWPVTSWVLSVRWVEVVMWWAPTLTEWRDEPFGLSGPRSPAGPLSGSRPASHFCPSGKGGEQKKKREKTKSVIPLGCDRGSATRLRLPASHQLVQLQRHLLLLVQLLVLDVQHHLEALQLLLQIQSVGVLLWGPEPNRLGSHHLWTSTKWASHLVSQSSERITRVVNPKPHNVREPCATNVVFGKTKAQDDFNLPRKV